MQHRIRIKNTYISLFWFALTISAIAGQWEQIPLATRQMKEKGLWGGEGCQVIEALEADHTDGSFLLMGTDVGGIYRSTNGGRQWEPCNFGYNPRGNVGFAIDPNNNRRALAVGGNSRANKSHGLYLTEDQGATWKHILKEDGYAGMRDFKDKITFVQNSYDREQKCSTTAYWSNPAGGIYRSADGGKTWGKVNNAFGACLLKVHPKKGFVYAANQQGLFVSHDEGKTFGKVFSQAVHDMDVVLTQPDHIYIATDTNLHISSDSGKSFTVALSETYPTSPITLDVSPANPQNMVLCKKVNEWGGPIYYTHNGGQTWQRSQQNHEDSFMPFNIRTQLFAWHPKETARVWALGGDWISSSHDGGANFQWDSNGYSGILVGGLFNFNPNYPDVWYLASQDYNGALSIDSGKTWHYCNASKKSWGGFTYGSYAASDKVLVTQVSPSWHKGGLIAVSRNGGISFTHTEHRCSGLEVACGDAKNPSVIYMSNFVSHDMGDTWKPMQGCDGVLIANFSGDKEVYGAHGNKVVRSSDKGITWQEVINLPARVQDVAYDHKRDIIYAVTQGDKLFQYASKHLKNITYRLPPDQYGRVTLRSVAIDPNHPKMVYTSGPANVYKTDSSIRHSPDAGKTWITLTPNLRTEPNIKFAPIPNEALKVRVHPTTSEVLVTTGCYGVWKYSPFDPNPAKPEPKKRK